MKAVLVALLASLRAAVRTRAALQLEVLALRHQLAVYPRRGYSSPGVAVMKSSNFGHGDNVAGSGSSTGRDSGESFPSDRCVRAPW